MRPQVEGPEWQSLRPGAGEEQVKQQSDPQLSWRLLLGLGRGLAQVTKGIAGGIEQLAQRCSDPPMLLDVQPAINGVGGLSG
jgi:hypothetical protein